MRAADSPAENRHITGPSGSQPRVFPGFFFFKNDGVFLLGAERSRASKNMH